ncbi:protein YIPF3-like isoform X1 [Dendronephthya gigantea]|uniref:protein YIPF3-like isoform X1 n=1 Tax=Dendronephthya gigantea TaxID=151771 RepID=UPI00106B9892|nr:protein YIPF3-like isoform X1 [Dendronephthya gigantea]
MATNNEALPPTGNGFDEWQSIDERNGSDKSSNSGSQNSSSWYLVQDSSSVVDMGDTDELQSETVIDIESSDEQARPQSSMSENEFINRMRDHMAEEVGGYVWNASKQTAKRAFDLYANIDILRPYFHVEPHEVRERLIASMMPQVPKQTSPVTVNGELYGPLMLVFTLIAILLFSMKSSGHTVQEGTLIGTAFIACFGYWLGASCIFKIVAHVCNTHLTSLQILSLTGYALSGPCICLFITTFIQHDTHISFYLLWVIFGGLPSLRMVSVFVSRTWQKKQGLIAGGIVAAIHMLFLLYLHFAFHEVNAVLSFEQDQIIIGHKYTTQVIVGENFLPVEGGRPHLRVARSLNSSLPNSMAS